MIFILVVLRKKCKNLFGLWYIFIDIKNIVFLKVVWLYLWNMYYLFFLIFLSWYLEVILRLMSVWIKDMLFLVD